MGSHLTFSREKETHGRWACGFVWVTAYEFTKTLTFFFWEALKLYFFFEKALKLYLILEFKLLIIIYPFDRDVYPKSGWWEHFYVPIMFIGWLFQPTSFSYIIIHLHFMKKTNCNWAKEIPILFCYKSKKKKEKRKNIQPIFCSYQFLG